MLRFRILIPFISLFAIISCDRNGIFEENVNTPKNTWSMTDIARFNVQVKDTISFHNIFINIRNTTDYPNSNLYLFITTTAPTGATKCDTLECFVADEFGKWLGKGFGFIRDNRVMYKQQVRFPVKGIYRFEVQQAMRTEQLEGIASVGLRIEKL